MNQSPEDDLFLENIPDPESRILLISCGKELIARLVDKAQAILVIHVTQTINDKWSVLPFIAGNEATPIRFYRES